MMERVENVAGEFRKAAHSQMAATTQRTIRENVNISSQLAQLTEKATNLTAENDKLAVRGGALLSTVLLCTTYQVREMTNKTKVSLLEAEIEKLSRRNAYRQQNNLHSCSSTVLPCPLMCALFRQKVIAELTDKCKSQEGKMEQVKGFEAERRKYEVDISRY